MFFMPKRADEALRSVDIKTVFFCTHTHVFGHRAVAAAFCTYAKLVSFLGHVFRNKIEHGITAAKT